MEEKSVPGEMRKDVKELVLWSRFETDSGLSIKAGQVRTVGVRLKRKAFRLGGGPEPLPFFIFFESAKMSDHSVNTLKKIAHELAQPLTTIKALSFVAKEKLANSPDPETAISCIEKIDAAANFASELLDRLRSSAGILVVGKNDKAHIARDEVNATVNRSLGFFEPDIRRPGFEVELEFSNSAFRIGFSEISLQAVLVNLIRNAIESCVEKSCGQPRLSISVNQIDGALTITVSDNGLGVPENLRQKIFRTVDSRKPNGMGIGLAICRETVEAAGGLLWYSDNSPCGANFHLALPILIEDHSPSTTNVTNLIDAPAI